MADISNIQLDGNTYSIKDATARSGVVTNAENIAKVANETNRKFVFIGDSYNSTDTPTGGTQITPWGTQVASYLNITSGDFYNSGVSGAGWSRDTASTFLQELQSLNIQNKANITDIVVMGGINDNNQTDTQVLNAVQAFSEHCAQYYPNAKIHVGVLGWSKNAGMRNYLAHAASLYQLFSRYKNIVVINGSVGWLHNYSWIQPDGNHPNLEGSRAIATHIANYLKKGIASVQLNKDATIEANTTLLSNTGTLFNLHQSITGETLNINTEFVVNYNTLTVNTTNYPSINLQQTNGRFSVKLGDISGEQLFWNSDSNRNVLQTGVASIMLTDNTYLDMLVPYAIETYQTEVFIELFGQITINNPKYIIMKPIIDNLTTSVTSL